MRINSDNKTMDMEVRDINYILPHYVRSYLFYSKNEMPEKIIFPMFPSVKYGSIDVPIEYVPPLDKIAVDIAEDGSNVAEVTLEQEAKLDEKDDEIKRLKAEVSELTQTGRGGKERGGTQEPESTSEQLLDEAADKELEKDTAKPKAKTSKARAAFPADSKREPKQPPGGDLGTGQALSDMHQRDRRDQTRTAKDLVDEPDIDEKKQKEFDKTVGRDEKGRPVVEDQE